jgi:hypothetical protein
VEAYKLSQCVKRSKSPAQSGLSGNSRACAEEEYGLLDCAGGQPAPLRAQTVHAIGAIKSPPFPALALDIGAGGASHAGMSQHQNQHQGQHQSQHQNGVKPIHILLFCLGVVAVVFAGAIALSVFYVQNNTVDVIPR